MDLKIININNNFSAKIIGKLQKEISKKKTACETIASYKKFKPTLNKALKQIESLGSSNIEVDIDKKDTSLYEINYLGNIWREERGKDKETYDYKNLINALRT